MHHSIKFALEMFRLSKIVTLNCNYYIGLTALPATSMLILELRHCISGKAHVPVLQLYNYACATYIMYVNYCI